MEDTARLRASRGETSVEINAQANGHVAETFAQLALEMHEAYGVDETVDAVVQFALQALTAAMPESPCTPVAGSPRYRR